MEHNGANQPQQQVNGDEASRNHQNNSAQDVEPPQLVVQAQNPLDAIDNHINQDVADLDRILDGDGDSSFGDESEYSPAEASSDEGGPFVDSSSSGEEKAGDSEWECPVCATEKVQKYALVPCGHVFCRRCTKRLWKSRKGLCAKCRKVIQNRIRIFD